MALLVAQRLAEVLPARVHVSTIARSELMYGARHSKAPAENLRLVEEFLAPLVSLPFDEKCADEYGKLREELVRRGQTMGPNDVLIAATALVHGLTLVSRNHGELSRIVGLNLEAW